MGGSQKYQQPPQWPNRDERAVGKEAVVPNGIPKAENRRDHEPQGDGLNRQHSNVLNHLIAKMV